MAAVNIERGEGERGADGGGLFPDPTTGAVAEGPFFDPTGIAAGKGGGAAKLI
jgi:hypothetical protein